MKKDIKDMVMDLLFEQDEEEVIIADEPLEPVNVAKPAAYPKAKEVIYNIPKPKSTSAFINVDEEVKSEIKTEEESTVSEPVVYEAQPNLSPIFGVIKEKPSAERPVIKTSVTAQTNPPKNSVLGTVLSPIFGYDTQRANEVREEYGLMMENSKEDESIATDVTDSFEPLFDSQETTALNELLNSEYDPEEIDLFEDLFGKREG